MDDRFLHELRRDPRPEFARELRERLRAQEPRRHAFPRLAAPALAAVAASVLVVAAFTVPAVRVSAQALLDLFRVRRFAAVPFDRARMDKIESLQKDPALVVFDRHETIREPGPLVTYPSPGAAGAAAGLPVGTPTYLPSGLALDSVMVQGEAEGRLSVSSTRLRTLLDLLDLRDVSVPDGIDGQWIGVRKRPVVIQKFKTTDSKTRARLVQSLSPEVSVPAGLDVVRLAEVGLRILGLDAGEARRIAQATDWRTTLLIPVPMNATTFRPVTIHGQPGLLVTMTGTSSGGHGGSIVLWSEGDRVFGLISSLGTNDIVQMAESVQ